MNADAEEVELFWTPGCSSCVKTKEFLAERKIAYRSTNVAVQPQRFDELIAHGFRGVPVVRKGDRYTYALSLEAVAGLLGVPLRAERLSVPVLMERVIDMLTRTRAIIAEIPVEHLDDMPIANRKRSVRDLAGHIFQVQEAFLQTMMDGVEDTRAVISRPCDDLETRDELLAYVDSVLQDLVAWWNQAKLSPLPDSVPTYYGPQNTGEFVERSVWHSAQHARQLDSVISEMNGRERALPPAIYEGLPLPKGLWE